jgi:hypothetical protein
MPEFYRIYRQEQAADEVRSSSSTGVDRVVNSSFRAAGLKLGPLFDGSTQLISITSIPSHVRGTFLPVP